MIKGLYAAASAMITNIYRQESLAHNIANVDTPGFRQILTSMEDFYKTPVIYPPGQITGLSSLNYIGNLGLGVEMAKDTNDFTQGGIKFTGNTLDLAIEGDGFFRIKTADGERYTRDGRFIRDSSGQLTTVDGNVVLDKSGQPVKIAEGALTVGNNGETYVNGTAGQVIGLVSFTDPQAQLVRDGLNMFKSTITPDGKTPGIIQQNYLEMSNANPSQLMTQLVDVARSYEAAQKMVQTQDEILGKTISSLGQIG